MKTVRFLVFRALLLVTFITAYVYFLFGQERQHSVSIVRNAAWNDLVRQMDPKRFNAGDCWERRLKQRIEALIGSRINR